MNSLGLEYGSFSSDEEDAVSPLETQTQSVTLAASAQEPFVDPDEALVAMPSENTAEEAVELTMTLNIEPLVSIASDEDAEAMLQQAGIPPPAPPLDDGNETQQRIERFLRVQRERGQDFQTTLQDKKEVRNPYVLEKVVEYFGINQLQSNFPSDKFDPSGLPLHEYADALALEQKKRANARVQHQSQDSVGSRQLHFVSVNAFK